MNLIVLLYESESFAVQIAGSKKFLIIATMGGYCHYEQ